MDVLGKLTFRNLKLNKRRTIVTVIGIILSVALITGVTTMLSSFTESTIRYTKQHFGDYHLGVTNVPTNDLKRIQNLDNVHDYFLTKDLGYGIFSYAFKEFPIQVLSFSDDAFSKMGIELLEGHLPQNSNEIVVSKQIEQRAIFTTISIFLYAFIIVTALIGITNIFNTITTSMELRQKEFAHLKSIGMTKKEFNKMIKLENIFLGVKTLIFGIPFGLVLSYIIYLAFLTNNIMEYIFPLNGIIISILAIFIILWCIMRYTLNKINKQNIIETIRRDNV